MKTKEKEKIMNDDGVMMMTSSEGEGRKNEEEMVVEGEAVNSSSVKKDKEEQVLLSNCEDEESEDEEDEKEEGIIQLGFIVEERDRADSLLLFHDHDWSNWDGGKVGGLPVRTVRSLHRLKLAWDRPT